MTATATSNDSYITEKAIQGLTIKTTTLLVYQTFLVHFFGVPLHDYDAKDSVIKITQCRGRGAPFSYTSPPPHPLFLTVKGITTLDLLCCHLFNFFHSLFKRFRKHCYLNASYVFLKSRNTIRRYFRPL